MNRNMRAHNFGLRSRNIGKAAINALRERESSYGSIDTNTDRFHQFSTWIYKEIGIKDMRWIEKWHVMAYAEHVANRLEDGKIEVSTAHNLISAVNVVLSQARGDQQLKISPSQYLPARNFVATVNRAPSEAIKTATIARLGMHPLGERLTAMVDLQEKFGLRFEESAKTDNRVLLAQAGAPAETTVTVCISDGTKGGRNRLVPITSSSQIEALQRVAKLQGNRAESHHHLAIGITGSFP